MFTAMLTVENIFGANHDIWSVNVEEEYHEEASTSSDEPLRRVPYARAGVLAARQQSVGDDPDADRHERQRRKLERGSPKKATTESRRAGEREGHQQARRPVAGDQQAETDQPGAAPRRRTRRWRRSAGTGRLASPRNRSSP